MSFLTPLYLLGALAVAAPIVFHLIRRSPKGDVPFSSLMFLAPSPPRLTRRSKLDNVLLLVLRATALVLLALAFTRPFWRQVARLGFGDDEGRRIAVLVDTSASLRRGGLWAKAKAAAADAIAACRPEDELAVFAFDATTRPLLTFAESRALDTPRRQAVAQARLARLAPTWGGTHLGQALVDVVAAIEDATDAGANAGRMPRRILLVSDLQRGSRLEALGDFAWPKDVELELKTVTEDGPNAGLQALGGAAAADGLRVRVSNELGSRQESFALAWVDAKRAPVGRSVPVYVPPGESRVVRMPRPRGTASHQELRLSGDLYDFDNAAFFAVMPQDEATVLYIGGDAPGDPAGLLYYLERALPDAPGRPVRLAARRPAETVTHEPARKQPLVVLASETSPENAGRLRDYLNGGGTVLCVLKTPAQAATLAVLAGVAPRELGESLKGRDVLLGEIAFDHPLFAPLSGAQFNDFTKIHFWKYRKLDAASLGEARVLARFETGDPAVVEKAVGRGRLIVLASGWDPADSQLARSSKFVPLVTTLLEGTDPRPIDTAVHLVADRVVLPVESGAAASVVIRKPDGAAARPAPGRAEFSETDEPGVYTMETSMGSRPFAVNLDPAESRTAPLPVETLEQLGCRLTDPARRAADRENLRQLHNAELEGRQKLWRWLILAAMAVLLVETFLAGRVVRPRSTPVEGPTS
jgi:hypothetical protein